MSAAQQAIRLRDLRLPALPLGALLALLTWRPQFGTPSAGLDPSSNAGLFMAVERGLDFGTEIIYTYGPLGYLAQGDATLWYPDLAAAAFVYSSLLWLALGVALVGGLSRTLGAPVAFVVAFVVLGSFPGIEVALVVAVAAALAVLAPDPPRHAIAALAAGGAAFAALELLVKLSIGPIVACLVVLGLVGARAGARAFAAFAAILLVALPLLWISLGQGLGDLGDYLVNSADVVSGYSEAMALDVGPAWQVAVGALAGILATVAAALGRYRDARARWCATAIVGIAAFTLFKEGVVRSDPIHLTILISSLAAILLLVPLRGSGVIVLAAGTLGLGVFGHAVLADDPGRRLDPVASVEAAGDELGTLLSPGEREREAEAGRAALRDRYSLDPRTLGELEGRTVAIDPWEAAIAWAYELSWDPLPVFQGYAAYTERLDRLNADAAAAADGPERILRVAPSVVGDSLSRAIDGRLPAWDPPAQALATLCNFETLSRTARFEVLGRIGDRCGEPVEAGTVEAAEGEPVPVPAAGSGEVVFARVHGAEVAGLERLRAFLYRARYRHATLDGERRVRLVPGTASDGLLLAGTPGIVGRGTFAQAPQASTIAVEGAGDGIRFDFFRMAVAEPRSGLREGSGPAPGDPGERG